MRVLLLSLVLIACGSDDPPPSPAQTICERAATCPNIQSYKTVDECARELGPALDSAPQDCIDCLVGLTCAGLAQSLVSQVEFYQLCPMCP